MNIWKILGIEPTKDKKAIKRAYAAQAKVVHPEEKPEEFKMLYEAYQTALKYAEFDEKKININQINFNQYGGKAAEDYSETSELISYFTESQGKQQRRIDLFMQYWRDFKSPYQNPEVSAWWQEYLASEDFQNIRWNVQIMNIIAKEIDDKLLFGSMELKMLFWKAYGFREGDETEYRGEQLKLRRCLYPAYEYYRRLDLAKDNRKIWCVCAGLALVSILIIGIAAFRYSHNKLHNEQLLIEQYMADEYPGIEISEPEKDKQNPDITYTYHSSAHPEILITAKIQYYYDYRDKQNIAQVTEEDYGVQLMEYYAEQYGLACGRMECEDKVYSVLFYPDIEQADAFCGIIKRMFDEEEELDAIHSVGICAGNVLFPGVLVSGGLSQFPFAELQIYDPHTMEEAELSSQIRETYMIYMFQYESWNLTAQQYEEWGDAYEKLCGQWEDMDGSWCDIYDPETGEFLCRLYIPTHKYFNDYYSIYKRVITVGNAYYFLLDNEADVTVKEDGSGFKVEFYGESRTFGEEPEVEFNELRKWY